MPFQTDILAETHKLVRERTFWDEFYTHGNRLNEQKGVPMPIVRNRCTTCCPKTRTGKVEKAKLRPEKYTFALTALQGVNVGTGPIVSDVRWEPVW